MGSEFFSTLSQGSANAAKYKAMFEKLGPEFHSAFYDADKGYYGTGLQTEQALPLYLGIVPAEVLGTVLNYTVNDIVSTHGTHTTSGIIGIKMMMEALTKYGYENVALDLALQNTYPSWGYMIEGEGNMEPATTIWELWDSDKEGPGMNSRNHIMFGTVSSWLYKCLMGINPETGFQAEGWSKPTIAPRSVNHANLTSASASVATPFGSLGASYQVGANDTLTMKVSIPHGVKNATVNVPFSNPTTIMEGGKAVWSNNQFVPGVDGVTYGVKDPKDGRVSLYVTSGTYTFTA